MSFPALTLLLSADGTPLWLVQKGKFAYRILPEYTREAFVTCETRPTDWVKRNKVNEKKQGLPSEARILRLWANHGQRPVDDTYGYVVYAGRQIPSDELPFPGIAERYLGAGGLLYGWKGGGSCLVSRQ